VGLPLAQLMQHLNSHLLEAFYHQSFVTMVCVVVDPKTGEVECVNAGHPAAVLIDAQGNQRSLQCAANLPLGIGEEILECEKQRIAPGEVLVLYSDGVTDLADLQGQRFGTQRFKEHLQGLSATHDYTSCTEFAQRLDGLLDAFQNSALPQDDRTFLVARRPA
jgi:serine phosphatase RsbU (regulator of sigma subunit)